MTIAYDPSIPLELWMGIGTAMCTEISENFATIEDMGELTAHQLQSLYDGGWEQKFSPVRRAHPTTHDEMYVYTFFNERGNACVSHSG